MTYRPWTPDGFPEYGQLFVHICSQDGDLVADTEQHNAHHKYLQGYFRPNQEWAQDVDNEAETEPEQEQENAQAHIDAVAALDSLYVEIRGLKNQLEAKRIELETQENTHRQDVVMRAKMGTRIALADEIVRRLDQATEITTDRTVKGEWTQQRYILHTHPQDQTMDRLVIGYQELQGGKS